MECTITRVFVCKIVCKVCAWVWVQYSVRAKIGHSNIPTGGCSIYDGKKFKKNQGERMDGKGKA